jgi:hypothetical protein
LPLPAPDEDARRERLKTSPRATIHKPPLLDHDASGQLRDILVTELRALHESDQLASWAQRRLPAKNTLMADDARIVEATYRTILDTVLSRDELAASNEGSIAVVERLTPGRAMIDLGNDQPAGSVESLNKPLRRRSKAHLAFVRAQPCVVCQRQPCDAHHLKFAQARALGRKVSDEFTVPMCRDHHTELHRHGNEMAWWANLRISPIEVARDFWQTSQIHSVSSTPGSGDEARAAGEHQTVQS